MKIPFRTKEDVQKYLSMLQCQCECHQPGWNGLTHNGYQIENCCDIDSGQNKGENEGA